MDREILFRGKRTDNGEWIKGFLFSTIDHTYIAYRNQYDDDLFFSPEAVFIEVDPETVCQYTGLEDKEGNKIWEHDLIEYSYEYPGSPWLKAKGMTDDDIRQYVGEVFFSEWRGTWSVCGWGRCRDCNQDVYAYSRNPNRTKVIGNVFDAPKLVEGGAV